jgi:hypothetical protein
MTEHPITMNTENVNAILEGRKTQHRFPEESEEGQRLLKLKPGERLWVQESHIRYQTVDHVRKMSGAAFSEVSDGLLAYESDGYGSVEDLKDHIRLVCGPSCEGVEVEFDEWQPAKTMPRWGSRITLEVVRVWTERVRDIIGTRNAEAEGLLDYRQGYGCNTIWDRFADLWDSTYGDTKFCWNTNPEVVVVEFRRVEGEG